jgi:hypothetical protein
VYDLVLFRIRTKIHPIPDRRSRILLEATAFDEPEVGQIFRRAEGDLDTRMSIEDRIWGPGKSSPTAHCQSIQETVGPEAK